MPTVCCFATSIDLRAQLSPNVSCGMRNQLLHILPQAVSTHPNNFGPRLRSKSLRRNNPTRTWLLRFVRQYDRVVNIQNRAPLARGHQIDARVFSFRDTRILCTTTRGGERSPRPPSPSLHWHMLAPPLGPDVGHCGQHCP